MSSELLTTQSEAVLHFFKNLDIDMVNELLDGDRTYSDLEKPLFIHKLGNAFDEFLAAGDEYLFLYAGKCSSVICDKQIFMTAASLRRIVLRENLISASK